MVEGGGGGGVNWEASSNKWNLYIVFLKRKFLTKVVERLQLL